jgi:peptidoglycan hydrolase-like protein with peptidoglycan-binding domain
MPHETVRSVQHKLNQLGYRAGHVDGLMGPHTHAAISAYQAHMGMTATGMLTPELADRIEHTPMARGANGTGRQ